MSSTQGHINRSQWKPYPTCTVCMYVGVQLVHVHGVCYLCIYLRTHAPLLMPELWQFMSAVGAG